MIGRISGASLTRRHILEGFLIVLVLAAGLVARLRSLDTAPFWVDEAESSINALTILQHGYPTDAYLGVPIYENTLVRPWPGNPEYEFRDVSYSDRHVAVYHGWLPLYSIAASFLLHGISPDYVDGSRTVKHDLVERKRSTRAARVPGALFASLFLLVVFAGAAKLYGRDAAWAALIAGVVHPSLAYSTLHARYYAPQIALTTACCVMLWLLLTRCRWKDVVLSAVALVLLFHTHLLSFLTAAAVGCLIAPLIYRRHEFAIRKMALLGALISAGTLPWLVATGFLRHQNMIPGVWGLLEMPADLFRYPPLRIGYIVTGIAVALLITWMIWFRPNLPARYIDPFVRLGRPLLFLSVWLVCAYLLLLRFMPAASFFSTRMNLAYWGPGFLLATLTSTCIARIATPRHSAITAVGMMLFLTFTTSNVPERSERAWHDQAEILDYLDSLHLAPESRLFASPNEHLIMTFYSGLPVQSITPVRKSFLDTYPAEIIYIDLSTRDDTHALEQERIRKAASREGRTLSAEEAARWSLLLRTRDGREEMSSAVTPDRPDALEPLPPFASKLLNEHRRLLELDLAGSLSLPIARGYNPRNWSDWIPVFQYRFSNPTARTGARANYAGRLRGADGALLSSGVIVYTSRWHPPETSKAVAYHLNAVKYSQPLDGTEAVVKRSTARRFTPQ